MLLLYELLHCSAIGSPTAGLGPRTRPKPAFADWLVGFWVFPSKRGAANRGDGGGSLVQLGPIVRPLPSLGLAQPAISSFLLLHPRSLPQGQATATHRTVAILCVMISRPFFSALLISIFPDGSGNYGSKFIKLQILAFNSLCLISNTGNPE
jgi:hypothetical protein